MFRPDHFPISMVQVVLQFGIGKTLNQITDDPLSWGGINNQPRASITENEAKHDFTI